MEKSDLKVKSGGTSSHTEAQRWHVNPTVTLSKDEEVILSERWELGKETEQSFVVVFSHLVETQGDTSALINDHLYSLTNWMGVGSYY